MGQNLILKKNDEYISDLGRSYHFETDDGDIDFNNLEKEIDAFKHRIIGELTAKIAYKPKDYTDMLKVVDDMEASVEYFIEESINFGKKLLTSYMLIDEGLTVERE